MFNQAKDTAHDNLNEEAQPLTAESPRHIRPGHGVQDFGQGVSDSAGLAPPLGLQGLNDERSTQAT